MVHSFLLIGQSNMAGRGDMADAPEIDTPYIRQDLRREHHSAIRTAMELL